MLVINIYGGPGSGKSTLAAELFEKLKKKNYNTELVTEFPKDLTWEENFHALANQFYVTANQEYRLWRLKGKVDIAITDSPILLGAVYDNSGILFNKALSDLLYFKDATYQTFNIFLTRNYDYLINGRKESKEEAEELDKSIKKVLDSYNIEYIIYNNIKNNTDYLIDLIDKELHKYDDLL